MLNVGRAGPKCPISEFWCLVWLETCYALMGIDAADWCYSKMQKHSKLRCFCTSSYLDMLKLKATQITTVLWRKKTVNHCGLLLSSIFKRSFFLALFMSQLRCLWNWWLNLKHNMSCFNHRPFINLFKSDTSFYGTPERLQAALNCLLLLH